MKKNIFSIIVIVLLVVNLVLTVVMIFAVLPNATKTNELISKVAAAIDLELAEAEEEDEGNVSIYDMENYAFENGKLYISLKRGETDTKDYIVAIDGITLHLNKKAKDFDDAKAIVTGNETKIKDIITAVYSKYTKDEAQPNKEQLKQEISLKLAEEFETNVVADISFGNLAFSKS